MQAQAALGATVSRARARQALRDGSAVFLLLVTPFTVYLKHHAYGLLLPEVGVCLAVLALVAVAAGWLATLAPVLEVTVLAGAITFFADVQFHPPKGAVGLAMLFVVCAAVLWPLRRHVAAIVILGVGTMLVSTLVLPQPIHAWAPDDRPAGKAELPLAIHIILDEHIGIEGLPADGVPPAFAAHLRSFFADRGFLVFGRAYSEYFDTHRSIAHLLNLQQGHYSPDLVGKGAGDLPFALRRNTYFDGLARHGYRIRAYQPDYMDFCGAPGSPALCRTYEATTLGPMAPVKLPVFDKASVIASQYLERSAAYTLVRIVYQWVRAHGGSALPAWTWERDRLSTIAGMDTLDTLARDAATARRGDFLFAHVLAPHYPYIYDAECRPRPPRQWLERQDLDDAADGEVNTAQSRTARYGRYAEQITCVTRKLDAILRAIPPALAADATIIVQGDHGSRITRVEPRRHGDPGMSPTDLADSYSTLFAVRSPGIVPGYDRRMKPITCLLRTFVGNDFRSFAGLDACAETPGVFRVDGSRLVRMPLDDFSRASVSLVAGSPGDAAAARP